MVDRSHYQENFTPPGGGKGSKILFNLWKGGTGPLRTIKPGHDLVSFRGTDVEATKDRVHEVCYKERL